METALITNCEGYKKLLKSVEESEERYPRQHDYREKLSWVLDRASHYSEKLGIDASEILNSWEKQRDYWFINFYHDGNQPLLTSERIRVFENSDDLYRSIGKEGFRCPLCNGNSKSPYECDSGIVVENLKGEKNKPCDWKVYGLFKDLGKGVFIYVKSEIRGQLIFMPIAWEGE